MKLILLIVIISLASCYVNARDFSSGNKTIAERVLNKVIAYDAKSWRERKETFFYKQPDKRKIKAIKATDLKHSDAKIRILDGGVGFSYVNMEMKSQRGTKLKYRIQIFVEPKQKPVVPVTHVVHLVNPHPIIQGQIVSYQQPHLVHAILLNNSHI